MEGLIGWNIVICLLFIYLFMNKRVISGVSPAASDGKGVFVFTHRISSKITDSINFCHNLYGLFPGFKRLEAERRRTCEEKKRRRCSKTEQL